MPFFFLKGLFIYTQIKQFNDKCNKIEKMKNGIIFDLDGTLWDARASLLESYNLTMKKHNLHYRFDFDTVTSYMGLTPLETVKLAFKDVSTDIGMGYFSYLVKEEIEFLKIKPGIIYPSELEVLSSLSKKYDLFIVSNCEKGYIETYLEGCNTKDYFKDHLCIGDTKKEKWENILIVKGKYNIENVIYVGDTKKDYIESSKAKVKFIHASYGFGVIEEKVNRINNLLELDSEIDKLTI